MKKKLALPGKAELVLDYHRLILQAATNKSIARWNYPSRKRRVLSYNYKRKQVLHQIRPHFTDLRRPEVTNSEMVRIDTYFVVKVAGHEHF